MKFTEQEAYEELVSKMKGKGDSLQASERTIKAMVKRYYSKFANDELELSDFVKEHLDDFKEFDGQARKDNADFAKAFKAKMEEEAKLKSAPKAEPTSEVETLRKELEAMKASFESEKREKAIFEKKGSLQSKMKELGIKDDEWIKAMVSKINVTEELDVETEASDFLNIYNKFKASGEPTATPNTNVGASSGSQFKAYKEAFEKKRQEENKFI